jgi:hypothetical protein
MLNQDSAGALTPAGLLEDRGVGWYGSPLVAWVGGTKSLNKSLRGNKPAS